MNEDLIIIKYKWEHGVYSKKDMVQLVKAGVITEK